MWPGLEGAADPVDAEGIVEDLHALRRVHVDGFVLSDRRLTAVIAHGRDAAQQKEREIRRTGGNDESLDLDLSPVVGLDRLGDLEVRSERIDQLGKRQPRNLPSVCRPTEMQARQPEAGGQCCVESLHRPYPKTVAQDSPPRPFDTPVLPAVVL